MADKLYKRMIEKNKDKTDLKPCIDFVARHLDSYDVGLMKLLTTRASETAKEFANKIAIDRNTTLDTFVEPQVGPAEAIQLLYTLPESLVQLSKLAFIQYCAVVPVPKFDENGNFNGQVDYVHHSEFPRKEDHPSRIMVGSSDGEGLFLTPIPKSVSTDEIAVKYYQIHVFLHEFFHTVELPVRDVEKRKAILLEHEGKKFTFQDFWDEFTRSYLKKKTGFVSNYAATYADKLNDYIRTTNSKQFDFALGEQVCESFVGYMLNIISNKDEHTNFKQSHPKEYALLDRLCNAKVIKTN